MFEDFFIYIVFAVVFAFRVFGKSEKLRNAFKFKSQALPNDLNPLNEDTKSSTIYEETYKIKPVRTDFENPVVRRRRKLR